MGDFKDIAVKYWPWVLGGAIGLYLISRTAGGGSSSPATTGTGMSPADQAYSLQAMQISTQSADSRYAADVQYAIGMAQVEVGAFKVQAERDVAMYDIASQTEIGLAAVQAEMYRAELDTHALISTATIAGNAQIAVANIAAGVQSIYAIADLQRAYNEPSIAAINAVSSENIAAINAMAALGLNAQTIKGDIAKAMIGSQTQMYLADSDVMKNAFKTFSDFAGYMSPAVYPQGQPMVSRPDTSWITDVTRMLTAPATGAAA